MTPDEEFIEKVDCMKMDSGAKDSLINIFLEYKRRLFDCSGCKYRDEVGCRNPKDCRRDEVEDRYERR